MPCGYRLGSKPAVAPCRLAAVQFALLGNAHSMGVSKYDAAHEIIVVLSGQYRPRPLLHTNAARMR
jgi:hypothetical protein